MDVLSHTLLIRPGKSSGTTTTQARQSVDFIVNGVSLLTAIVKVAGGHADLMGCLVRGFPEQNAQAVGRLTCVDAYFADRDRAFRLIVTDVGRVVAREV